MANKYFHQFDWETSLNKLSTAIEIRTRMLAAYITCTTITRAPHSKFTQIDKQTTEFIQWTYLRNNNTQQQQQQKTHSENAIDLCWCYRFSVQRLFNIMWIYQNRKHNGNLKCAKLYCCDSQPFVIVEMTLHMKLYIWTMFVFLCVLPYIYR